MKTTETSAKKNIRLQFPLLIIGLFMVVGLSDTGLYGAVSEDEIPGRSISPLEDISDRVIRQRHWIEARLRQLQAEQENLRSLLNRLDAGMDIQLPEELPLRGIPDRRQLLPSSRLPLESESDSGNAEIQMPLSWSRMSVDQRIELHQFAVSFDPKIKTELDDLRENNPQQYEKIMSQNGPRLVEMMQLKAHDPEMYDLKRRDALLARRTVQLAASVRKLRGNQDASEEDLQLADEQEKELRDLLREHFDVRQRIREYELDLIALRLRDLEEELSLRNQHREKLLKDRLAQLLKDSE